jgi:hypothetical protein
MRPAGASRGGGAGARRRRTLNLRCLDYDAYFFIPRRDHECRASWNLRNPGTYRVVVMYYGPSVWPRVETPRGYSGPAPENDSMPVALDTGMDRRILHPLVDGRRMADTATLVVVVP